MGFWRGLVAAAREDLADWIAPEERFDLDEPPTQRKPYQDSDLMWIRCEIDAERFAESMKELARTCRELGWDT